jgi:hypothetical protein
MGEMTLRDWYKSHDFLIKFFLTVGIIIVFYAAAFILGWYQMFG